MLERLSRMVRLPHEFYPGSSSWSPEEQRRFAVSVLLAADKRRAYELQEATPPADPVNGPSAEVVTAVAVKLLALRGA